MVKEKVRQFVEPIKNNPSFTVREQLGYAGGIFGNAMGQDSVETFTDKFCRNFMGINNARMTIMADISFVANFIANPVAGHFLDRPAPEGKATPTKRILKATPIPFAIASLLLFVVPSASHLTNFIWAVIFKVMFGVVDSFYDMSLNTMSLRMTNNASDRKNFYTVSTLAGSLGSMLPGSVIPVIVNIFEGNATKQKWTYFFMALLFCVIGVGVMLAPYFTLNEKIKVAQKENDSPLVWDRETISAVLHNRTFIIVQIGNFFEKIRGLAYRLLLYLYEDILDYRQMKVVIDTISGSLSYVGLLSVPFITKRLSARTVMSLGYGYTAFFYGLMSLFNLGFKKEKVRKYKWLIGLCIGLAGMPNNAMAASKKVVIGDSTDYMEWYAEKKFNKPIHAEGLICSVQAIFATICEFIGVNIFNSMFSVVKYKESIVVNGETKRVFQSDSTIKGLYMMFTLFGFIGNTLASLTYLFDNYTGEKRNAILAELREMREKRALEMQDETGGPACDAGECDLPSESKNEE